MLHPIQARAQTDTQQSIHLLENTYSLVSVAFSAADLNNPESVFGHVFIVFHNQLSPQPNDPVIEFYGLTEQSNWALLKTVTSHINGIYKQNTWAEKLRTYDQEGRDVYLRPVQLHTTAQKVLQRTKAYAEHTWPYNFLNVNCAFYLERLLSSNPDIMLGSTAIRQPLDVYLNYGNSDGELVFRSSARLLAEYQISKNSGSLPLAMSQQGLTYYKAHLIARNNAANSNIDQAALTLMQTPAPEPALPAANIATKRRSWAFHSTSHTTSLQYLGFDTAQAQAQDPVFRPSGLEVAAIYLNCTKNQNCEQHLQLFEVNSSNGELGFGRSKHLSVAVRFDKSLNAGAALGIGLAYTGIRFVFSSTPIAWMDSDNTPVLKLGLRTEAKAHLKDWAVSANALSHKAISPAALGKRELLLQYQNSSVAFSVHNGPSYGLRWAVFF